MQGAEEAVRPGMAEPVLESAIPHARRREPRGAARESHVVLDAPAEAPGEGRAAPQQDTLRAESVVADPGATDVAAERARGTLEQLDLDAFCCRRRRQGGGVRSARRDR